MHDAQGMVVAKHSIAAEIGASLLRQGGNAFDAAVAMGFALGVVEPHMSGIGGGTFQLVYRDAYRRLGSVDAPVVCPAGTRPGCYAIDSESPRGLFGFPGVKDQANEMGHQSVAVPGVLAGLCFTLERLGTRSLSEVMQPAIGLAEHGYPLSWIDIVHLAANYEKLIRFPATAAIFLADRRVPIPSLQYPLQPIHLLVQRDLAHSLRLIAQRGPDVFYQGELAGAIVNEVRAGGGWLSSEDLAAYRVREVPVITGRYREWELVTGPDVEVLEALSILEHFDVRGDGHNSAATLHHIAAACLLAHADFYHYITSLDQNAPDPTSYISAGHILSRVRQIEPHRPVRTRLFPDEAAVGHAGDPSFTTTGYAAADHAGNVVVALQTHGWTFGSGVTVPGTGILLNDQMLGFNPNSGTLTSVAPGRTRPIPGWPVIGIGPDGSYCALGSPGGNRVLGALTQVLSNTIDFNIPMDRALAAPRIDCGSTPAFRKTILANSEIDPAVVRALEAMGHRVELVSCAYTAPGASPLSFAAPAGLGFSATRKNFTGGNDPPVWGSVVVITP